MVRIIRTKEQVQAVQIVWGQAPLRRVIDDSGLDMEAERSCSTKPELELLAKIWQETVAVMLTAGRITRLDAT